MPAEFRDRDVRNAMRDLCDAAGAFDLVTCGGLPETQNTGAAPLMIVIEPLDSTDDDRYDDGGGPVLIRQATAKVTVITVDDDPVARDEAAERLCNVAANAWNGVSLAGLTFPDRTRLWTWRWLAPKPPERRVEGKFIYSYEVGGFGDFDIEP